MRSRLLATMVVVIILLTATAAYADPPAFLGGVNLLAFCQSMGFTGVALTKPQIGDNAAINNWRCVGQDLHPFSFEQACKFQYGVNAVQAHPLDRDDAFTWVCFSTAH